MSKLITFGCSNTYGQGLPDCGTAPKYLGDTPSKLAWPSILALKLKVNCDNQSNPGNSNKQILWQILNYTSFTGSDIVIVMWAPRLRSSIITGRGRWDHIPLHINEWLGQPKENRIWRKYKVKTLNEYDNILESLFYIDYAHRTLIQRVGTVLHYISDDDVLSHKEPYVEAKLTANGKRFMNQYPASLDGKHPGVEGHAAFADKIYKDLQSLRKDKQ